MTLPSLFIVCSHGHFEPHWIGGTMETGRLEECPGGRPATLEDLGGEKVWWCRPQNFTGIVNPPWCHNGIEATSSHEACGYQLIIPLPQMVAE